MATPKDPDQRSVWHEAPAHEFLKTEALSGRASERTVRSLINSMKLNGWDGEPIVVVVINTEKYIINGHHRVCAARVLDIPVLFSVIARDNLINSGRYSSTDQVVQAHVEAVPNRIRLRR